MCLDNYLAKYNITDYEGHSSQIPQQMFDLKQFLSDLEIKEILEIGFNAGHSSDLFLSNSIATVTSFDLNERPCVNIAKKYIDIKFPSRHTLINGDSTKTIPEFIKNNKNKTFDIIFIDGLHQCEQVAKDINNSICFLKPSSFIIIEVLSLCTTLFCSDTFNSFMK